MNIVDAFLRYRLFTVEAEFTAPIHGSAAFARTFVTQGPKDKQGRSFREFDLQTRIFKYPCSYLIYSDGFDQLPENLKTSLYQKLFDVLTGKDRRPEWSKLSPDTRQAIREICRRDPARPAGLLEDGPVHETGTVNRTDSMSRKANYLCRAPCLVETHALAET